MLSTLLPRHVRAYGIAAAMCTLSTAGGAQSVGAPAIPLDPVEAILSALETHQVVALGDWHNNVELHGVRLALLRHPRFPDVVQDIVVEFGVEEHQGVLDAYIEGAEVGYDELARVWLDSPFAASIGPVYEEFYRGVRDVNVGLPPSRRLRVHIDNPVPRTMQAESELIRRKVIAKGRNALIIFGGMHFPRQRLFYPVSDRDFAEFMFNHPDSVSTVSHLEAAGITVFSIRAQARDDDFVRVQPDIAAWTLPALTLLKGTVLGAEPFATFAPKDTGIWVPDTSAEGGHSEYVLPDPARSGIAEDQFDAILLLGSADSR
jgi:hypothetical protein